MRSTPSRPLHPTGTPVGDDQFSEKLLGPQPSLRVPMSWWSCGVDARGWKMRASTTSRGLGTEQIAVHGTGSTLSLQPLVAEAGHDGPGTPTGGSVAPQDGECAVVVLVLAECVHESFGAGSEAFPYEGLRLTQEPVDPGIDVLPRGLDEPVRAEHECIAGPEHAFDGGVGHLGDDTEDDPLGLTGAPHPGATVVVQRGRVARRGDPVLTCGQVHTQVHGSDEPLYSVVADQVVVAVGEEVRGRHGTDESAAVPRQQQRQGPYVHTRCRHVPTAAADA